MPSGNLHSNSIIGIIPMKPAAQAKTRLASVLEPSQRATISLNMLEVVAEAAVSCSLSKVIVLGGDSAIHAAAEKWGAEWIADKGRGLNAEVSAQIESNSTSGAGSMYLPGDLALLTSTDVDQALNASERGTLLTMCPAVGDGGTNGLVIPAQSQFQIQLGTDSFNRHKNSADRLGLPYAIVETRGFGLDLDTASDLDELQRMAPGALERLLRPGDEN
ncbi:MAG: 2-phospho-L-lactate guanylyltransferase [SAR202 cluster bacterium]|nr:2-phospho-L-lactate guanylyltransferase [SAR202 cluster bacterium]MDP6714328.1 2-phospho-L-lactate guanylyltransferase [SAR202 cluster bacterium]